MRIGDIRGGGALDLFGGAHHVQPERDNITASPKSWGSDRVSLSPEALAALHESRENSAGAVVDSEPEVELNAGNEFKAYMKKKRSRAQGSENITELIERLKEQAAEISKKIEKAANDTTISEAEREALIQSLTEQLQQIETQISELQQEMLKLKLTQGGDKLTENEARGNTLQGVDEQRVGSAYSPHPEI